MLGREDFSPSEKLVITFEGSSVLSAWEYSEVVKGGGSSLGKYPLDNRSDSSNDILLLTLFPFLRQTYEKILVI